MSHYHKRACWMCGRQAPRESMWVLDGWDTMHYVCVACVDVMREHRRQREQEEDPAGNSFSK